MYFVIIVIQGTLDFILMYNLNEFYLAPCQSFDEALRRLYKDFLSTQKHVINFHQKYFGESLLDVK